MSLYALSFGWCWLQQEVLGGGKSDVSAIASIIDRCAWEKAVEGEGQAACHGDGWERIHREHSVTLLCPDFGVYS